MPILLIFFQTKPLLSFPDVVEKSTEIFCPSQYSLLRCSGDSTITVTRAVFALDTLGHCGQRQRSNRSSDGDCSLGKSNF